MLSYAGRLQLVASILASMQVYWASVFILPRTVVKDIDRLLKGFLWCQGDLSKRKPKVAWKQICRPKNEGGLGIKNLYDWNEHLLSLRDKMKPHVKYEVGDGKSIFLWHDRWYGGNVTNEWDEILIRMTALACNNPIMSVLRRIVIAACVYCIWNERNRRVFENEKRSYGEILLMIISNVRMKLAILTVKSSNQVDEVSKTWQITMNKRKDKECLIGEWNSG
nr:zf-RVT domain-containing protein [Tanacetum cinerariifolium]